MSSVVECVERSTLGWFGYLERMENEDYVEVYLSSVEVLVGGEGHLGDGKRG